MDKRIALSKGTGLAFPGMECSVEHEIGRGANAIVYKGTYQDLSDARLTHHVLIKELYPFVPEGEIRRREDLSLVCDEGAQEAYALHRLSFERGNESHLRLLESSPDGLGANLNTFPLNGTLYTVLGYNSGRSLDSALKAEDSMSLRGVTVRMMGILRALRVFHDARCLHLDISPDNILVIGNGPDEQIVLIDFNSVYSLDELQKGVPLYYSTKEGYTAPEVRAGRVGQISLASDLYSVAAVFYRMMAGAALTQGQMLRKTPPDVSGSPCMQNQSPSALSMVKNILKRGLAALPHGRYQTIAEMQTDLQELLDRIDGVGVTHWALWEAGKRTVTRLIKTNPSLGHLRGESTLLPLRCKDQTGATAPVQTFIAQMTAGERASSLMIAPGGMGKTTALLDAVEKTAAAFSAASTAVVYVPLYGYHASSHGDHYIITRILEELRFRAEVSTYEEARHVLSQLLDEPIRTRQGEKPMLLLLLDGLNEVEGDVAQLVREMAALSEKAGVRLLVTSRSDMPELPFGHLELMALEDRDVQGELSRHGLLTPEDDRFCELLHTPIMLSMFVRASLAEERQLNISSADELLETYLSSILGKAQKELPEQSPLHWQLEAAVKLVLPAIAYGLSKHAGAMDHAALLGHVQRCFDLLPTRQLKRLFPQWTGHVQSIRGDAKDADAWFGLMVHELLWQQLGLVERDDQGCYRTNHQIINDYLVRVYQSGVGRAVKRRHAGKMLICIAALAVILGGGLSGVLLLTEKPPVPYPEESARAVFEDAVVQATQGMGLVNDMTVLVESAVQEIEKQKKAAAGESDELDLSWLLSDQVSFSIRWQQWTTRKIDFTIRQAIVAEQLRAMQETGGEVIPWSGQPFEADALSALMKDSAQRPKQYQEYAENLHFVVTNEVAQAYYPSYTDKLQALLAVDAQIMTVRYQMICRPHQAGLKAYDADFYTSIMDYNVVYAFEQEAYEGNVPENLDEVLSGLLRKRAEIESEINQLGVTSFREKMQRR